MRRDIILKPSSDLCNKVYRYFSVIQYFVYKLHGLSPWTLKVSEMFKKNSRIEDDLNQVFKISYIGSFYNILLMLGIVLYRIYLENALRQSNEILDDTQFDLPEEIPGEKFGSKSFVKFTSITWLMETISVLWIQLFYVYKQKSMINIINRLSNVDRKLNIRVDSYAKKILIYFIFMLNFLFVSARIILAIPIEASPVISIVYENFPTVMYSWIIVQFIILLTILEEQFKALNLSIKTSNFSQISRSMVGLSLMEESAFQEIDHLESLYIELYDICEEINNFYELLLLMSILCFNYNLILFISFFILNGSFPSEIFEILFFLAQVIFVPWVIFLTLVLTFAVSKTIDQSQETGPLIILLSEQCPMNPQVNERLVKFSRDLLFFKVEFSAWGTFPLNRNLLRIVCGTVTTFVVVIRS
ncbi:uncharacterized protein LOC123260738 [Cotesia glomerata]|uniref:uncharacterized protein LOC123260738 n=1 Tax=Cotesia glomerata TaxID=32391 RepID=UPI001D028F47|nr:uncharacterized protein LOC123260738 [Cotesia glomerata]